MFYESLDIESKGYRGEKLVFDVIRSYFKDRECSAKHSYVMNFPGSKYRVEADVLLFDEILGINLFEVKGIGIDNIRTINIEGWICEDIYSKKINPVYQSDRNTDNLIAFLKNQSKFSDSVGIKSIIVLPYITSKEWRSKGFDNKTFLPPILFKEDLEDENEFFNKLSTIPYKCKSKNTLPKIEFDELNNVLFGDIEDDVIKEIVSEDVLLKELLESVGEN